MFHQRRCSCGTDVFIDDQDSRTAACPTCGASVALPEEPIFDTAPTAASTLASGQEQPGATPRWLRLLLDPEAIQRLLGVGGAVCVLGIIVWLVSLGVFDDPRVLAAACGSGTLIVLGSGWAVSLKTKHQTAGQAITFLGCLLAPLNLWLYDAQNLVTLEGHLWVGGLACVLLYLATVRVLRSPVYLYAFEAGLTLTMVLLLGAFDRATDSLMLCSALMTLAGLSIHAERAFPVDHVEFDRRRYGWPLFVSGQIQLMIAMASVLALQLAGWGPWAAGESTFGLSRIATAPLWTTGMWLYAAYLWLYSDLIVLRKTVFREGSFVSLVLAALTLLHSYASPEATIALLALATLAVTLLRQVLPGVGEESSRGKFAGSIETLLPALPLLLGLGRHLQLLLSPTEPTLAVGWEFAGALLCVAITTGIPVWFARDPRATTPPLAIAGLSLWVSVDWALRMLEVTTLARQLPILLALPLTLAALQFLRPASARGSLRWSANLVLLAGGLLYAMALPLADHDLEALRLIPGQLSTLLLAACGLELAVFFALSDRSSPVSGLSDFISMLFFLAGIVGGLRYFDLPEPWLATGLMTAGLGVAVVRRVTGFDSSNGQFLIGMGQLVAICRGLSLLAGNSEVHLLESLPGWAAPVVLTALAALATPSGAIRRWHAVAGIGLTLLTSALVFKHLHLADYQQLELAIEVLGLLLVGAGYSLRLKETDSQTEPGTAELLWIGSLLATLPVMICTLWHRFGPAGVSLGDELGLVTIALLMIASGCILQTRATTLIGAISLTLYLFVLLGMLVYQPQITMGAYLAIGGGLVFATGVLLSIYRDRLLALPTRISQREGIFRVIGWR